MHYAEPMLVTKFVAKVSLSEKHGCGPDCLCWKLRRVRPSPMRSGSSTSRNFRPTSGHCDCCYPGSKSYRARKNRDLVPKYSSTPLATATRPPF